MYVGSSVRQILGYDPDAIVGRHVFEFCHPDDAQPFEQTLEQMALKQHGSVQTTEVRIRHCDGSWRVMEGIGRNLLADPIVKGIVVNARDITERKLMAKRLEFVKSEEQQRIRYDLHDTVGQDLTGLLCLAGSLAKRLRNGSDANAERAEAIMEGIRHTISDVREAIHGISPVEADPRGLEVALGALVDKTRAQHGIDAQFECHAPVPISDYGAATQLFRIAQEAVTNVVKHAQAHQLVLSLTSDDKGVVLRITDDGVGTNGREKRTTGMGLQTMRSRAEAIGATLQVWGQVEGAGTRVECTLSRDRYAKETEENGPLNFQI
jgi:PAS domain S-box-containing protein